MKRLLENMETFLGTELYYPYTLEKGNFVVSICHNRAEKKCCVFYAPKDYKKTSFGKREKDEIKKICKQNKIIHKFRSSKDHSKKMLILYKIPPNKNTFYNVVTEIDKILGLPTEELDETKL